MYRRGESRETGARGGGRLNLEMGRPKFQGQRTDLEMGSFACSDGQMGGGRVVYGELPPEGDLSPNGYRIGRDKDVAMLIDGDRPNLTYVKKQWRRHHLERSEIFGRYTSGEVMGGNHHCIVE